MSPPFWRSILLVTLPQVKPDLLTMVSVMPQQAIKIFPNDLNGNATGRFQSKDVLYKKAYFLCARHDLNNGDKMECHTTLIPVLWSSNLVETDTNHMIYK